MMLPFSRHLDTVATVYDCMDELSAFRFAPTELLELERELLEAADMVFTGGYSLYEAKKKRHGNVHPLPLVGRSRALRCRPRRDRRSRPTRPRSPVRASASTA
jgi:UDP-galactopyranose mutase